MHAPALAAGYFALQGAAVLGWWCALVLAPSWRSAFTAAGAPQVTLLAFAPPDLLLLVAGSAAVAVGRRARRRWTAPLAAAVAGAALYATSYVAALWLAGATSPLGTALMLPSAVLSAWGALVLARDASRPLSPGRAGERTPQPGQDGAAVHGHLGADTRRAAAADPPA